MYNSYFYLLGLPYPSPPTAPLFAPSRSSCFDRSFECLHTLYRTVTLFGSLLEASHAVPHFITTSVPEVSKPIALYSPLRHRFSLSLLRIGGSSHLQPNFGPIIVDRTDYSLSQLSNNIILRPSNASHRQLFPTPYTPEAFHGTPSLAVLPLIRALVVRL